MVTHAAQLVAFGDEVRAHAMRCGYDLNTANLIAHRMLMHALTKRSDFEEMAAELRALAEDVIQSGAAAQAA
jgi:Arc/MetJ family transcription regulator